MGPVTASPMARPRLRRNHREMITGQVTAWLTPDAPSEMTTIKRKKRYDAGGGAEADETESGDDGAPENQFARTESGPAASRQRD